MQNPPLCQQILLSVSMKFHIILSLVGVPCFFFTVSSPIKLEEGLRQEEWGNIWFPHEKIIVYSSVSQHFWETQTDRWLRSKILRWVKQLILWFVENTTMRYVYELVTDRSYEFLWHRAGNGSWRSCQERTVELKTICPVNALAAPCGAPTWEVELYLKGQVSRWQLWLKMSGSSRLVPQERKLLRGIWLSGFKGTVSENMPFKVDTKEGPHIFLFIHSNLRVS